ncbi:hypothetical protein [Bradyrhizobium sp.]|uniref:hypothetical protein n=1 Tax=Bradyrhizobium sp. TaxID=376 RepID=UPI003C200A09
MAQLIVSVPSQMAHRRPVSSSLRLPTAKRTRIFGCQLKRVCAILTIQGKISERDSPSPRFRHGVGYPIYFRT